MIFLRRAELEAKRSSSANKVNNKSGRFNVGHAKLRRDEFESEQNV